VALQEAQRVQVARTPQSILEAQLKAWDQLIENLVKDPFIARLAESQKAWAKRVVAYELANSADFQFAYEHFFGKMNI
jgi:TRAP-type mannitol/chloroaromatic compound transport system substrate-binding protein